MELSWTTTRCWGVDASAPAASARARSRWMDAITSAGEEKNARPRARVHSIDRKSTRLNSSHLVSSYAVFCLKKKTHGGAGMTDPHEPPPRTHIAEKTTREWIYAWLKNPFFFLMSGPPPNSTLFPSAPLSR